MNGIKLNTSRTLLSLLTGYALLNCSAAMAVDRICNPFSEGGSVNCPVIEGDIIKASNLFPNSGHVHGQYISSATPSLNASGNSITLNGAKTSGASVGLIGGGIQLKTSQGNIPLVGINLNNNKLILNNGSLVHSFVYGSMLSANAAINFTGNNDPVINMNGNSVYINSGATVGTGNLSDVSSAYTALLGPVNLESNVTLNAEDNNTVIDGGVVAKGNVQALRGIVNNVISSGYLKLNGNNNTVIVKNNADVSGSVYGTHGVLGHSTTQSDGDGLVSENLEVTFNVDNTSIDVSDSNESPRV